MRENENRSFNPSAYTTPASVFNTLAVDFDQQKIISNPIPQQQVNLEDTTNNEISLKTVKLPAAELLKLDPVVDSSDKFSPKDNNDSLPLDMSSHEQTIQSPSIAQHQIEIDEHALASQQSTPFPIPCEIINALTQQTHSIDPMYNALQTSPNSNIIPQNFIPQQATNVIYQQSNYVQSIPQSSGGGYVVQYIQYVPPQTQDSIKSRSLERNINPNINVNYDVRGNSLERAQSVAKPTRSISLTRQFSAGQDMYSLQKNRSASLERGQASYVQNSNNSRTGSLERNNQQQAYVTSAHKNSLDRNQAQQMAQMVCTAGGYRGGSLERNQHPININHRGGSLERNQQFQVIYKPPTQTKQDPEPFQEEIYDFGGANVKSCASIAMNKNIAKGIVQPNAVLPPAYHQQKQQQQYPRIWTTQIPTPQQNLHHNTQTPSSMHMIQQCQQHIMQQPQSLPPSQSVNPMQQQSSLPANHGYNYQQQVSKTFHEPNKYFIFLFYSECVGRFVVV